MIAFFDASALIYLIEGAEPFASRVRTELAQTAKRHPRMGSALSRLSWLECRVRPARNGELATLAAFDAFFALPDLIWVDLGKDVVELATAIRVKHKGNLAPDRYVKENTIRLFPNPAVNNQKIIIENSNLSNPFTISVTDITGKKIIQKSIVNTSAIGTDIKINLELNRLISGTYLLSIHSNGKIISKKIIVAK